MSEPATTTSDRTEDSVKHSEETTEHTCACGETHEHRPGTPSHREECTSPKKFGDSCCCGSVAAAKNRTPCGHGPRCH